MKKMIFDIQGTELEKLKEWKAKHDASVYTGAIGGRYSYTFTPTGIGTAITVYDHVTKEEVNITDYESW